MTQTAATATKTAIATAWCVTNFELPMGVQSEGFRVLMAAGKALEMGDVDGAGMRLAEHAALVARWTA